MIKNLIQAYINKTKNKDFIFDKNLKNSAITALAFSKTLALLRSLKLGYKIKKRNKVLLEEN